MTWQTPTFTNISRISYSIDGKSEVTIQGNTTIAGLADGAHNVTVYVKDTFGNIGVSQAAFFIIKAEPFSIVTVVAVLGVSVTIIMIGSLIFWKKRRKHFIVNNSAKS